MATQQTDPVAEAPKVHDGSVHPEPISLPELYFKARCAAPDCKALLGGFHVNGTGLIVFSCPQCSRTTVFKHEAFGIKSALAGPLVGAKPCTQPNLAGRTRGQRGGRNR